MASVQPNGFMKLKNFIDGEFEENWEGGYIDSFDPATGKRWALLPDSGQDEVDRAVIAANKAFHSWSALGFNQRSALLSRVADILESRLDEFAELESRDQGKPVWLAKTVDIPRAVHNFRFFATYILHHCNKSRLQEPTGAVQYSVKEPVGVAGLISPWNLPLYLLSFKLAPALGAGNTVVAKPSELTSVTAFKLCQVFKEAGVPQGVVNVVFGTGAKAGSSLVSHPDVPLISFTGGTVTAEKIRTASAATCKKYSLELGGKNAAVVFADVDLDKCVSTCIRSSFMNQGEICLCTSRIFVQKEIFNDFLQQFIEKASKLKVGDPKEEDVFMGPLVSREHANKVQGYIQAAKNAGATIFTTQQPENTFPQRCQNGYFVYPTVITGVTDNSAVMKEEIFGPVTCIVPFNTEEEVVYRANDVKYGLCATVWTKDLSRAHRMSRLLKAGTVWVNCWLVRDLNMPFGGVKESGTGREGGEYSMDFFTQEKNICLAV